MLCKDLVFKSIFSEYEDILAKMIKDIIGDLFKGRKIRLETNELPISKENEKSKRCDFIVRVGNRDAINIELNKYNYNGLVYRNLSYLCHIFTTTVKSGEQYDDNVKIIQINFNRFSEKESSSDKILSEYYLKEGSNNTIYVKNLIIFTLDLVKCYDVWYNKCKRDVPKYVKWGAMLMADNIEDIEEIGKGILTKKERSMIMSKLNALSTNDLFWSEAEALEWEQWEKNSIRQDAMNKGLAEGLAEGITQGIAQGISQGITQGIETEKLNTIKIMLKDKVDLKTISKYTGKSIKEIKELQ